VSGDIVYNIWADPSAAVELDRLNAEVARLRAEVERLTDELQQVANEIAFAESQEARREQ
jgi:outer membrane murein-binding lipoprotein Lpp